MKYIKVEAYGEIVGGAILESHIIGGNVVADYDKCAHRPEECQKHTQAKGFKDPLSKVKVMANI